MRGQQQAVNVRSNLPALSGRKTLTGNGRKGRTGFFLLVNDYLSRTSDLQGRVLLANSLSLVRVLSIEFKVRKNEVPSMLRLLLPEKLPSRSELFSTVVITTISPGESDARIYQNYFLLHKILTVKCK